MIEKAYSLLNGFRPGMSELQRCLPGRTVETLADISEIVDASVQTRYLAEIRRLEKEDIPFDGKMLREQQMREYGIKTVYEITVRVVAQVDGFGNITERD